MVMAPVDRAYRVSLFSAMMRSLHVIWRDVLRKVRQVGLLGAIHHCLVKCIHNLPSVVSAAHLDADPFDLEHGTDTASIVGAAALDVPDGALEHVNRYEAVAPQVFSAIMRDLRIAHEHFVFVDIGCGKGRALLLASRFPFKQIIGIDISKTLVKIATNNVQLFKDELRRSDRIRLVCRDACSYEPPFTKLVVFFYNPFDEHVMQLVLSNVEKSLRAFPRKIYVVYHRPLHRNLWDGSLDFRPLVSTARYVIYESNHTERNLVS